MKAQQILVEYMWWKQRCFGENTRPKYMTQEIEKDMLKWDDDIAQCVLSEIRSFLEYHRYRIMLSTNACPYCIKERMDCDRCYYGQVRGKCEKDEHDVFHYYLKRWLIGDYEELPGLKEILNQEEELR